MSTPLLLTTTTDKRQDAVVAWDPLAGNAIASFTGDLVAKSTLMTTKHLIISAVSKKPLIQFWSFESMAEHKRLTTKGIVNALTFTDDGNFMFLAIEKSIYIYQVCSGCLLSVLEAGHAVSIGHLKVSSCLSSAPVRLLSADFSGHLNCWLINSLGDELNELTAFKRDANESSEVDQSLCPKQSPSWFAVQASRTLPTCEFIHNILVVAVGTEGVKFFGIEDGLLRHNILTDSPPLLSLCFMFLGDLIFTGTDNGILHTVRMPNLLDVNSYEITLRRCFTETNLSTGQKAIVAVCLSPYHNGLLAVGARCGMLELLRVDTGLTRLQRFSCLHPSSAGPSTSEEESSNGDIQLTGLLFVSRPAALSTASLGAPESTQALSNSTAGIRPLKRHMGWHLDDLFYLKLPNLLEDRVVDPFMTQIYKDEFLSTTETFFAGPSTNSGQFQRDSDSTTEELHKLRSENHKLLEGNRKLLRRLVSEALHY